MYPGEVGTFMMQHRRLTVFCVDRRNRFQLGLKPQSSVAQASVQAASAIDGLGSYLTAAASATTPRLLPVSKLAC